MECEILLPKNYDQYQNTFELSPNKSCKAKCHLKIVNKSTFQNFRKLFKKNVPINFFKIKTHIFKFFI